MPWPNCSTRGWIYLVRCGDFVKLGFSTAPDRRLIEISRAAGTIVFRGRQRDVIRPARVSTIARVRGTLAEERNIHHDLKAHRVDGEWYRRGAVSLLLAEMGLDSAAT